MKRIVLVFILLIAAGWHVVFSKVVETAVSHPTLTNLPTDRAVYKILLDKDGVYEITYEALQTAEMPVATVDPHTFALMHRGEPVAFQFDGDTDEVFEPGESLRFYGWAFDSSRYEKQFVTNNVFWLWVNDMPTQIETIPNTTHSHNIQTSTTFTVTKEPENDYFSGWTDQWDTFPNEPDAWYWDRIPQTGIGSQGRMLTYTVQLPHPDTGSGETAVFTTEFTSRAKAQFPNQVRFNTSLSLNNSQPIQQSWSGRKNVNLTGTSPASTLQEGENWVTAVFTTTDVLYLNRITVSYPRRLMANNNQLMFNGSGSHTWQVSGFTETDAEEFIVWEIGEKKRPYAIPIHPMHLSGTNDITVTFGMEPNKDSTFLVTTHSNIQQPDIQ
ncbi:MAG: hypothetical protein DWQ04_00690, partial [Chloroflexi bacterium]